MNKSTGLVGCQTNQKIRVGLGTRAKRALNPMTLADGWSNLVALNTLTMYPSNCSSHLLKNPGERSKNMGSHLWIYCSMMLSQNSCYSPIGSLSKLQLNFDSEKDPNDKIHWQMVFVSVGQLIVFPPPWSSYACQIFLKKPPPRTGEKGSLYVLRFVYGLGFVHRTGHNDLCILWIHQSWWSLQFSVLEERTNYPPGN